MERKMTIARGLTRLKTIKAQMENITKEILLHGSWSSKEKHPYGESSFNNSKNDIQKNHQQAKEKVNSLFQQFNDLLGEYVKIKTAIDRANLSTKVEIHGKLMSLQEAMILRRDIDPYVSQLISANRTSVLNAERKVNSYNQSFTNVSDDVKEAVFASVVYLVDQKEIDKLNEFRVEFLTEIDGVLNEINAVTEIEV